MGFFDRFGRRKEAADWSDAYEAAPRFYEKPGAAPFGSIVLTEDTKTVLPKHPQTRYLVDGKAVSEWKLFLFSLSGDAVIGSVAYPTALERVGPYALDENQNAILVRGLSLAELEGLMG